jgi:7,8-dihydropterin-6-yl-methyl-4-(beta-D-ribofuranosyl)aminobenzene 5'-phosphate synthase
MTRLTIVFDNYAYLEGFPTLWGFSCYIETPAATLLFDTGSNGRVLLKNMQKLGTDVTRARALVLSHPHWDHIGGVDSVLEANPNLELFVPSSLSRHFVRDLRSLSAGVTVVGEAPEELLPGIWSTGVMGEIGEQSLLIMSDAGPVVITGCAHPGIVRIAERATEMAGRPPALLMGGFHLMYEHSGTIAEVVEALAKLGVARVCPTHCTGDLAISIFAEAFGERFLRGGVGRRIEL